ncbi:hypothetical protein CVT26_009078 [Gymnopilus dilepis]|uniref:Uncharacterized protein n=1 Tax=Gymnopilus dilepis TaxID=231916 RepID=A0A409YB39_9AGAR|nr:hypothetical protein CVT26_009078 [Gymnopilus dilepis]
MSSSQSDETDGYRDAPLPLNPNLSISGLENDFNSNLSVGSVHSSLAKSAIYVVNVGQQRPPFNFSTFDVLVVSYVPVEHPVLTPE